jgi:hypothetical protein
VVLERPSDWKSAPPDLGANLGGFEVRDVQVIPVKTRDPRLVRTEYRFLLSAWETGEFEIPALGFLLTDPSGRTNRVEASAVRIVLKQTISSNDEPAGQKPLIALKDGYLWLKILVFLVGLSGGALTLFFFLRRKKILPEILQPAESVVPPDVLALSQLDELERSGIPESPEEIKIFYTRIVDIFRAYLARVKGVVTMERTTEEILGDLAADRTSLRLLDPLREFLEDADLVKFAKRVPSRSEIASRLPAARGLVEAFRPNEPSAEAPVSGTSGETP